MPELEPNPSMMRGIAEASGRALDALRTKFPVLKPTEKITGSTASWLQRGDTIMQGESGKFHRDLWQAIQRRADQHESIINQNNQKLGVNLPEGRARQMAMKRARAQIALKNDAHIVGALKWTAKEHGPDAAARLGNWWQMALRDREYFPADFRTSPEGKVTSKPGTRSTSQLRENIMKARDIKGKLGKKEMYDIGKAMKHAEKTPEGGEVIGKAFAVSRGILSPFAAAKHLEQFATLGSNQPAISTIMKTYGALFGTGRQDMMNLMRMNDAGGLFLSEVAAEKWRYQHGYMKKLVDAKWISPKTGQFLSKHFGSMPGMRDVRDRLVPAAAAKGYFITTHEINKILQDPKAEGSRNNLVYMGFPRSVQDDLIDRFKANGMKLAKEDAQMAIDTAIEQYAFTNNSLWRSKFALHPQYRFFTTYHWAAQGTKGMFQRDVMRAMHSRNPIQMAYTMAAYTGRAGVIFAVSKIFDMLRGTQDPVGDSPEESAKRHFRRLSMLADMIGWGTEWSYINGALHNHLADNMYGAQGGNAIRMAEDFAKGTAMTIEGRKHAMYPFKRDFLEELPWFLGDRLAHSMYPTTAEKAAARPMTKGRISGKKGALKRAAKAAALGED